MFPEGAAIIPNPYNKIAGFSVRKGEGGVFFVPGFPVMAWPMIEWVLDTRLRRAACARAGPRERSVIVFGAMEAALTPLMEAIEARLRGRQGVQPAERRPSRSGAGTSSSASRASRPGSTPPIGRCSTACGAQGAKLGPELVR